MAPPSSTICSAELDKQAIRARIVISESQGASSVSVETPYVESFNVHRARGQAAATFSASIKVTYAQAASLEKIVSSVSNNISIYAGHSTSASSVPKVFTGIIYQSVVNPVRSDARYLMVNLSGKDCMSLMEGQKINRRMKKYRDGTTPPQRWGIVNSIVKQNTPVRQRFPLKVYEKKTAAVGLKYNYNVQTPSAFPEAEKSGVFKILGQLTAEKVVK